MGSISGLTRKLRGQVAGVTFVLGDMQHHAATVAWLAAPCVAVGGPRLGPRLVLTMLLLRMLV